eukprot:Plantae.Rhodophyta-Palmaria_palmata.ctg84.p2 GENE.Plantae.Rhodophyta-Palmaria_palmata.ctg84~~Plantae.Rhodophyta-Palmaria_palmata.ctg84.p2  ORF type:complete len:154 (-),score=15.44 Plantae.Rhodophyta-Palmaria_palmata.ctg84:803-1264(-)
MNLLRFVPPDVILDACELFEGAQRSCFTDILRHPVPDREWELAQQPPASFVPALGLATASVISPTAYVNVWDFSEDMVKKVVLAEESFISLPLAIPAACAAYSSQLPFGTSTPNTSSGSAVVTGGQIGHDQSALDPNIGNARALVNPLAALIA